MRVRVMGKVSFFFFFWSYVSYTFDGAEIEEQ